MNRQRLAAMGCILGAALAASAVQAQEVHKCTVNGQVTYQAKACAASDVVVPIQSGPSAQEQQDARGTLYRQRFQAATGRLLTPPRPAVVRIPPPPAPAPAGFIVQKVPDTTTTTLTTTTKVTVNGNDVVERTRTTQITRTTTPPPLPAAKNNCEKLDRENGEAIDRRDELKSPGELQSRQEMLANVQAQIDRIHGLAQASNCRLSR